MNNDLAWAQSLTMTWDPFEKTRLPVDWSKKSMQGKKTKKKSENLTNPESGTETQNLEKTTSTDGDSEFLARLSSTYRGKKIIGKKDSKTKDNSQKTNTEIRNIIGDTIGTSQHNISQDHWYHQRTIRQDHLSNNGARKTWIPCD